MSEPHNPKSRKILNLRQELRAAKNRMLDAIPRAELDAALKKIEELEAEVAQLRAATRKRRSVKENTQKPLVGNIRQAP